MLPENDFKKHVLVGNKKKQENAWIARNSSERRRIVSQILLSHC